MNAILTDEQRQTLETLHSEGRGGRGRGLEDLNLTDEQSAQIEAIRAEARSQQAALLTAEQQAILGDGELGRGAGKSLDLTDEQREQMRAIHEASHEQIAAILTDEQRQQLPEHRGNRGGSQSCSIGFLIALAKISFFEDGFAGVLFTSILLFTCCRKQQR